MVGLGNGPHSGHVYFTITKYFTHMLQPRL